MFPYFSKTNSPPLELSSNNDEPITDDIDSLKEKIDRLMEGLTAKQQDEIIRLAEEMARLNQREVNESE